MTRWSYWTVLWNPCVNFSVQHFQSCVQDMNKKSFCSSYSTVNFVYIFFILSPTYFNPQKKTVIHKWEGRVLFCLKKYWFHSRPCLEYYTLIVMGKSSSPGYESLSPTLVVCLWHFQCITKTIYDCIFCFTKSTNTVEFWHSIQRGKPVHFLFCDRCTAV